MHTSPFDSLMDDPEVVSEIRERLGASGPFPGTESIHREVRSRYGGAFTKKALVAFMEDPVGPVEGVHELGESGLTEAIILAFGRPSLLVSEGGFELPASGVWADRLRSRESGIERLIPSVGRVELLAHPDYEWVGTAWVVDEDTLVTNRHVAMVFAEKAGGGYRFKNGLGGRPVGVRIDFREEYSRPEELEIEIEKVLFIADPGQQHPDIALLKVRAGSNLPDPIPLSDTPAEEGMMIGVVGYPARDSRNAGPDVARIFEDIFDVKRFAPGYITHAAMLELEHDCSTLGGNSGSPVFDLETGRAVGLHFAGRFKVANYAVPVEIVKSTLARRSMLITGPDGEDETPPLERYEDCEGYRENFLGRRSEWHVPLPGLSPDLRRDAVSVNRRVRGIAEFVLDYTHFSVVMSKSRRMAMFTAVNLDGSQTVLLRRRNTRWKIDPRIERQYQFGNELYARNRLDRGHLVRRLDPVWGPDDVAVRADEDTFHYTNCAPQHERLNQRAWLSLEDYLLRAVDAHDFKASVFTGPVFGEGDVIYREARIPNEFWKVAVMVGPDDRLHATAYLLSQNNFLDDLEFVFDRFRTYQVPIRQIEEKTGLDFTAVRAFDPLERIEGPAVRVIEGPEDLLV